MSENALILIGGNNLGSKWSSEEEKYLIDNWCKSDIGIIMEELNRTEDSITRKAQRLGLAKGPKDCLKKRWTTTEEKIIYEFYQLKSVNELLTYLPGRTRESIVKKAKQLGLSSENRYWSEEQVAYLEEKWGVLPVENIARKLERTKSAILLKAHKIGLREQAIANGEYLTPKYISSVLAVGVRTVYSWMDNGYLKHRKLKINSIKKYQITISNLKLFLENYQGKWNACAADIAFIKMCFTTSRDKGKNHVPEWLIRKIELDKQRKPSLCRKQWTIKEEITLSSMINRGVTCKEIAALLNRSFYSIQGKVSSKRYGQQLHNSYGNSTSTQELNQIMSLG